MTTYRSLRSLRDQARQVQPDPAWVRSARATLLMQVKNAMPTEEAVARDREPLVVMLFGRAVDAVRGPVLAIMSVLAVVLGGSIASVSASEQSLPGDVLYPVKLVTEQARLAFTSSEDKVRVKSEFTQRRVEEFKAVSADDTDPKKDARMGKAADVLKSDLDTLRQQLSDVQGKAEPRNTAEAAKIVDKQAVEVAKTLSEASTDVSAETKEKVDAAKAQAVDVGINALEVLVSSQAMAGGEAISESELGASVAIHTQIVRGTVADAKALATFTSSSSTLSVILPGGSATSTKSATSTTALKIVADAEASLATLDQLILDNQLGQVVDVLKDVTLKSMTVQKQTQQDAGATVQASTSSTPVSSDATVLGTTTSTPTSSTPKILP
jgi:hypothetical protein